MLSEAYYKQLKYQRHRRVVNEYFRLGIDHISLEEFVKLNRNWINMAMQKKPLPKKVGAKKVSASKKAAERVVREITSGIGMPVPPVLRESKYDWDGLAENPLNNEMTNAQEAKYFFVSVGEGDEGKAEAKTHKTSVFTSGMNYYKKRNMGLIPVVRLLELEGVWGVIAFAKLEEEEE